MSYVNYTKCDICGKDINAEQAGTHKLIWKYSIRATGYRSIVGSLFGTEQRIDLCESCWNDIKAAAGAKGGGNA